VNTKKQYFLFIALAFLLVILSGCRNQSDSGEELSYILMPGGSYAPNVRSDDLLPLRKGAHWTLQVRNQKGDLPEEEQRVTNAGATGGTIETIRGGKVVQTETYRVSAKGIEILATGVGTSQTLNPPVLLIALPPEEEKVSAWQGTAGNGKQTFAGQAWSRVTRRENVTTPAGTFAAWRVDTRTDMTLGKAHELVHFTRWLTPGIGIVRQRLVTQGQIIVKDLKKLPDVETTGVK
jgi:hypothetical protein